MRKKFRNSWRILFPISEQLCLSGASLLCCSRAPQTAPRRLNDSAITQTMRETEGLEQSAQYIFRTITEGIKSRLREKRSDGEGEMAVVTEEDKKGNMRGGTWGEKKGNE